jgi:hypothetical protein
MTPSCKGCVKGTFCSLSYPRLYAMFTNTQRNWAFYGNCTIWVALTYVISSFMENVDSSSTTEFIA